MPDIEKKRSYREIPASTKPFSSTLKWIFEYYSMQLSVDAKKILETNFIQTDILYLTDEKRYLYSIICIIRLVKTSNITN